MVGTVHFAWDLNPHPQDQEKETLRHGMKIPRKRQALVDTVSAAANMCASQSKGCRFASHPQVTLSIEQLNVERAPADKDQVSNYHLFSSMNADFSK